MNLRALVLGGVFGFLVALTPSCSGSQSTCDGCIDASGACVKLRDINEAMCGVEGIACQACGTGQTCEGGVCTTPDGGPQQGQCREPCPSGCCDANGECQECKNVGASCTQDSECKAQLGPGGLCKKATTSGSGTYQEGYCTLLCDSPNFQCPNGSICVSGLLLYGEEDVFCWDACAPTDACRDGYACYPINVGQGQTAAACWLNRIPDYRAPAGFAGSACLPDGSCTQPPYISQCIQETLPDGGEAFPGGLCTSLCDESPGGIPGICGPDGVCVNGFFSSNGQPLSTCFRSCVNVPGGSEEVPDGGCRDGYACQPFVETDGGLASDGFCAPSCEIGGCGTTRVCATEGEWKGLCLLPDGGF